MPLQVLPPGVTSLLARATPSFSAEVISVPSDPSSRARAFAAASLARDPRNAIAEADVGSLRVWTKAVLGNAWREDVDLGELMTRSPQLLYKAMCLYLQGRYWGTLPNDYSGPSIRLNPQGCQRPPQQYECVNPAFNWPNPAPPNQDPSSPIEQRIFTWQLDMLPVAAPSWLAEDVSGAIYMPIITPTMLIQKFDDRREAWRVLNAGGTDRNFSLEAPGGAWVMKGWDFGEWFATNADFATVLKIVGFAVVAVAGAVTGGAALVGGASLFTAFGAASAAMASAGTIVDAAKMWLTAAVKGDLGEALKGLAHLVHVSFGIDLKSLATYQPGIDQIAEVWQPVIRAVDRLGGRTASDVYSMFLSAGTDAAAFAQKTEKLVSQLSADTTRELFGMFPDQFAEILLKQTTSEIGVKLDAIRANYTERANAAIKTLESQIPQYMNDWKTRGMYLVKQIGHEQAAKQSNAQAWFGRPAFDAGTAIGAIQSRLERAASIDVNALTPAQKRALFFGEVTQLCGTDPNCIQNAAEYLRQADLLWEKLQYYVQHYKLGGEAESRAAATIELGTQNRTR